jgi:hypothetical protein
VPTVSFWLNVGIAYLLLLGLGLAAGAYFGSRGRGGHGGGEGPAPAPVEPVGPLHSAEWLPLGSDFDRAFLPGVSFTEADALVQ